MNHFSIIHVIWLTSCNIELNYYQTNMNKYLPNSVSLVIIIYKTCRTAKFTNRNSSVGLPSFIISSK